MKKSEWQDLFNKFDRIHSDFLLAYPEYDRGKNKKIRDNAERKIGYLLQYLRQKW